MINITSFLDNLGVLDLKLKKNDNFFSGPRSAPTGPETLRRAKSSTENISRTNNANDFKFSPAIHINKIQMQVCFGLIWANIGWVTGPNRICRTGPSGQGRAERDQYKYLSPKYYSHLPLIIMKLWWKFERKILSGFPTILRRVSKMGYFREKWQLRNSNVRNM